MVEPNAVTYCTVGQTHYSETGCSFVKHFAILFVRVAWCLVDWQFAWSNLKVQITNCSRILQIMIAC